jgi:hypothetical protein
MEKYKALCHGDKIGTKEALNQNFASTIWASIFTRVCRIKMNFTIFILLCFLTKDNKNETHQQFSHVIVINKTKHC